MSLTWRTHPKVTLQDKCAMEIWFEGLLSLFGLIFNS